MEKAKHIDFINTFAENKGNIKEVVLHCCRAIFSTSTNLNLL